MSLTRQVVVPPLGGARSMSLAARLKDAIEHRNRSIRWLATQLRLRFPPPPNGKATGVSYASIHGFVNGKRTPSTELVKAIADLLDIRAAWLLLGEGSRDRLAPEGESATGDGTGEEGPENILAVMQVEIPGLREVDEAVFTAFADMALEWTAHIPGLDTRTFIDTAKSL